MEFTADYIEELLRSEGEDMHGLFAQADMVRRENVGSGIYLRGLIEYSNICRKDCLYCGIRRSGDRVGRYVLTREQVLDAARRAYDENYGSIVLQAGESVSEEHISLIESLLREIKELSGGRLGITLSLGEQTPEVYKRWFDSGAHRYLLRIETSDRELYSHIHPDDGNHTFGSRVQALNDLRATGYQVGTGVMIGIPGQDVASLARDILFMKELDIDMCGMGPYVESEGTPMASSVSALTPGERLNMTYKMISVLRLVMPDINIAAATALQAIEPNGRAMALECGANVIMPNITPGEMRSGYTLYNNKPLGSDSAMRDGDIVYGEWSDSLRFARRNME